MDDKLKDVMASVVAAVGSVAVYMGWTDEVMWQQLAGGIMMIAAFVMPYMLKKDA